MGEEKGEEMEEEMGEGMEEMVQEHQHQCGAAGLLVTAAQGGIRVGSGEDWRASTLYN